MYDSNSEISYAGRNSFKAFDTPLGYLDEWIQDCNETGSRGVAGVSLVFLEGNLQGLPEIFVR